MRELLTFTLPDRRRARVAHSTRADGDLSPATVEADLLADRRSRAVPAGPWYALHQVHGCEVIDASEGGEHHRPDADALVTDTVGRVLAVHSGDCVPVGLVHHGGAVAVAHAGWKGLEAGVIGATTQRLRDLAGDGQIDAAIGPHIRASRYEFGNDDLDRLAARFGDTIRSTSAAGSPALDLTAATRQALAEADCHVAVVSPDCTAALEADYWSHRSRNEAGRIALVAWLEPT